MMLETIRSEIQNTPCISFEQYFSQYVTQVQDENIEQEMKFFSSNNILDIHILDQMIHQAYKELIT